jgi:hypothetical protein
MRKHLYAVTLYTPDESIIIIIIIIIIKTIPVTGREGP